MSRDTGIYTFPHLPRYSLQMLTCVHTGPQAIPRQMGEPVLHARRAPTTGGQAREPAPPARRIPPRPQPVLRRLLVRHPRCIASSGPRAFPGSQSTRSSPSSTEMSAQIRKSSLCLGALSLVLVTRALTFENFRQSCSLGPPTVATTFSC